MITLVAMAAAAAAVAAAAWLWQRSGSRPAPTATPGEPPSHLDRSDFRAPELPWLIAVFTAATCASCAGVLREIRAWDGNDVVVQDVEVEADSALHRRYRIDSVPLTVIADRDGNVHHAVFGPLGPADRQRLNEVLHG